MMREPKSVLVVSLGGLGDFLTRWPLWQSLRKTFPRAGISYLGYPAHGALLASAGLCDEVLDFNEARWSFPGALTGHYECVVSLLGARWKAWVERLTAGRTGRLVEIEPFPHAGAGVSVREHVMAQALSMGFTDPGPIQFTIPIQDCAWADGFWSAHGLTGKRVVAVHPGSGGQSKNWPHDRFVELAARLITTGTAVIIFEGEAEKDHPRSGDGPSWPEGVLIVSNYKLVNVAALLARCDWYIGNDSGISHCAALVGVPSTVIFGPTDPALWAPGRGESVAVVKRPIPCAPCARAQRDQCAERRCLTGIGVDKVLGTIVLT